MTDNHKLDIAAADLPAPTLIINPPAPVNEAQVENPTEDPTAKDKSDGDANASD